MCFKVNEMLDLRNISTRINGSKVIKPVDRLLQNPASMHVLKITDALKQRLLVPGKTDSPQGSTTINTPRVVPKISKYPLIIPRENIHV